MSYIHSLISKNISVSHVSAACRLVFLAATLLFAGLQASGQETWYSYRSGEWSHPDTWTTDPGGTTLVGSHSLQNDNSYVILTGRTVTMNDNLIQTGLSVTINDGGIIRMEEFQFQEELTLLDGQGTIGLKSTTLPAAATNTFIQSGGGTYEFTNTADFNLPVAIYNNLTINLHNNITISTVPGNITLNGNLTVANGIFQINDDISGERLRVTIYGSILVNTGSSFRVGQGNVRSNESVTGITGGTAPFVNYYVNNTHTVEVHGNFTNYGTVRFTNQNYPVYNAFPTNGAASVFFRGTSNSTLVSNGTTDFYNLILDKGSDQTAELSIRSSNYGNFRIFGANISGGELGGNNPVLKKALWLRNGTLRLFGEIVIPSLTEGMCDAGIPGGPDSDFYIPANAALIVEGPDVIVLGTAAGYQEVNAAYGTAIPDNVAAGINTGAGCSAFSILGKFQINNGYVSTRESSGIIYLGTSAGEIIINGGTLDAKQLRTAGTSGGLTGYRQTGGTVTLRGRLNLDVTGVSTVADLKIVPKAGTRSEDGLQVAVGTFNIDRDDNIFEMSGGEIRILDVPGSAGGTSLAYQVNSLPEYYNVTGGTISIIPTTAAGVDYPYQVASSAPFYNFRIDGENGTQETGLTNIPGKENVTGRTDPPLKVLNNLTLYNGAALNANGYEVLIGGDFTLPAGTTYIPNQNITTFNGNDNQIFSGGGTITGNLHDLKIDKPAGVITLEDIPAAYTVSGSLDIARGTLDDGGKTLNVAGNIFVGGTHTGDGKIVLNGTTTQTIEAGIFGTPALGNIELTNASGNTGDAVLNLLSNVRVNRLTMSSLRSIDIGVHELSVGEGGLHSSGDAFGAGKMIFTSGTSSSRGLSQYISLSGNYPTSQTIATYPIGVGNKYTPLNIQAQGNAVTGSGTLRAVPVDSEHPASDGAGGDVLPYYWRTFSSGFGGIAPSAIQFSFTYIMQPSGPDALMLNDDGTWNRTAGNISGNNLNYPGNFNGNGIGFVTSDFTSGNPSRFNRIEIFYSITTGNWNLNSTWSHDSHTGTAVQGGGQTQGPGPADWVIIGGTEAGGNHIISTNVNDRGAASLRILGSFTGDEQKPTLDIGTTTGHHFDIITGDGRIRTATPNLPTGDYGEFITSEEAVFEYTGGTYNIGATLPAYPNLHITSNANNSTKTLPDADIVVRQALRLISASTGSTLELNNSGSDRSLTVYGDVGFANAGRLLVPSGANPGKKTINIYGDINFRHNNTDNVNAITVTEGAGTTHTLNFYGSNIISGNSRLNLHNGTGANQMDLIMAGEGDVTITNTTGEATNFNLNRLIIDKSSLIDNIYFLNNFTLGATTDGTAKALELNAGTLHTEHPETGINLSSGGAPFRIPQTTALILRNGASVNVTGSNTGIFLDGLLKAENSTIDLGDGITTDNRYIEYSGSGNAAIGLTGNSTLTVNSQIRRSLSQTNGILSFTQSGNSEAIIYGLGVDPYRAKLEITNSGSHFSMSDDATLTIVRGGGTTFGDLYLRPSSGIVSGGTINLGTADTGGETIRFDAAIPLNRLNIVSPVGLPDNGVNTATIMINPLVLEGLLTISAGSTLVAGGIDLSLRGDFTNNGTYDYGTGNTTTFNGLEQTIDGTTATDFFNLTVRPATSLTLIRGQVVNNNLVLSRGTLNAGIYSIEVKGDLTNTAIHNSSTGRLILNGTGGTQGIFGTGVFGILELDNNDGARLNSNISLTENFHLTNGILNVNQHLLTLGPASNIIIPVGEEFGPDRMITPNGVFSNVGIRKYFPAAFTGEFIYPLGVTGATSKYTPATLSIQTTGAGFVRINSINQRHPATLDPWRVLNYHWEAESSIADFEGNLVLKYNQSDVREGTDDEALYVAARVIVGPGDSWSKASTGPVTDNVDEQINEIFFDFPAGTNNLGGEYTAGRDEDIPDQIPIYYSKEGERLWNEPTHWEPEAPAGGPSGFIVVIPSNSIVKTNGNRRFAYRTTINGRLEIGETYDHNLGSIRGTGTLALEDQTLPAGRFTAFFSCSGGTLEFGGNKDYTIIADRIDTLRNLHFLGTGTRTLPNKDLVICNELRIGNVTEGPTVSNASNRQLTIGGTMVLNSGTFQSGTGEGATVIFKGHAPQTLSGFNEATGSPFNNIEIDNAGGLTLGSRIDINGNLSLTNGVITTTEENILYMRNPAGGAVVNPEGGSPGSYISGPMMRYTLGENFIFPAGKGTRYGRLGLYSPSTGNWTAEYFNAPFANLNTDATLNMVSSTEHWRLISPSSNAEATVQLRWDGLSDISPLTTAGGISDIRVAEYNGGWTAIPSTTAGTGSSGTALTTTNVTISNQADLQYYTLGSVSEVAVTARFAISEVICDGTLIPVTFSGVTQEDLNYELTYTINDGGITTENTIVITSLPFPGIETAGAPGIYKLTGFRYQIGATPQTGIADDAEIVVNLSPGIPTAESFTRCGPGTLTLQAAGAGAGEDYRWYTAASGGTLLQDGGSTFTTPYLNASATWYAAIYNTLSGCEGPRAAAEAIIHSIPEYAMAGSQEQICEGESFTLTINFFAITEPYTIQIFENATMVVNENNQLNTGPYIYTNPVMEWNGTTPDKVYSYTVSIQDANGCFSEQIPPVNVTVYKIPETGPQYHIPNTFGQ